MGGNHSQEQYSDKNIQQIEQQFKSIGERSDPLYGNIKVFQDKMNEEHKIYQSYKVFQTKHEHQKYLDLINQRCKMKNDNVSGFLGYHNIVDE